MSNYRTIDLERHAAMFKALSNPHRLQIYTILAGCCDAGTLCSTDEMMSCCVGELDQQLDIASSTLSHHLKELNRADLVHMQRDGKRVYCSLNPSSLAEIINLFPSVGVNIALDHQTKEVSHGSETS
jgi:DNA-binding transcriptional ArsR family regulator